MIRLGRSAFVRKDETILYVSRPQPAMPLRGRRQPMRFGASGIAHGISANGTQKIGYSFDELNRRATASPGDATAWRKLLQCAKELLPAKLGACVKFAACVLTLFFCDIVLLSAEDGASCTQAAFRPADANAKDLLLEYAESQENIDMQRILRKVEQAVPSTASTPPIFDDDSLNFLYVLNCYMWMRYKGFHERLELIWRRSGSREKRILILLVHYDLLNQDFSAHDGWPNYRALSDSLTPQRMQEINFVAMNGRKAADMINGRLREWRHEIPRKQAEIVSLEYPDPREQIDMEAIFDKASRHLPKIPVGRSWSPDSTDFFSVFGHCIQLRAENRWDELELLWRRSNSREKRLLILLAAYPLILDHQGPVSKRTPCFHAAKGSPREEERQFILNHHGIAKFSAAMEKKIESYLRIPRLMEFAD